MKIAVWLLAAVIAIGAVSGLVYLGTRGGGFAPQQLNITEPIKNPEPSSGKQTYQLEIDGYRREFIVYRPDDLADNEEVPVVFMYHGSGQSGEQFYKETGWKQKADEDGFMVVYPTGMKYHLYAEEMVQFGVLKTDQHLYQTKWNSYELPGLLDPDFSDQVLHDDVKFTREMAAFLGENYAVDEDRFYATGFSNGAQMVFRLTVETPDVFAAYAPVSAGAVPDAVLAAADDAKDKQYRPVMQVVGADDDKTIHAAGVEELTHDESAAQDGDFIKDHYIANTIDLGDLADEYTYEQVGGAAHFTYTTSEVGADNEYQIFIADGMGHIYPNGKNFRVDVCDLFWPFFERYSL